MKLSEACRKAAEIMSEKGHIRGVREITPEEPEGVRLFGQEPGVCLMGAVSYALAGNPWVIMSDEIHEILKTGDRLVCDLRLLENQPLPVFSSRAVTYNDLESTTKEDVVLLLKRMAEKFEEEGK